MTETTKQLIKFAKPLIFVVGSFLPFSKNAVIRVGILGIAAALFNTAGFLILIPVLKGMATEIGSLDIFSIKISTSPEILITLMIFALIFVALGLFLRYLIQSSSLIVMKTTAEEATIRALLQISSLSMGRITRRVVATISGRVAFSCGFVMRQLSIGLADLLQLLIFTIVLTWISPVLTLSLITPAIIILIIYTRSIVNITNATAIRRDSNNQLRQETEAIASILNSDKADDEMLREHVDYIYRNGAHGSTLNSRIGIRLEIQKGPMIVEALFPMALIMLMLLTLATENWREHSGYVVVYILILRVVIGLSQKLSGLIISTGHFHPDICCYEEIMRNRDPQNCRFNNTGMDLEEEF